jgi:erythronate-4-phosphate dehydrogenase
MHSISYHSDMKILADKYLYKLDELLPETIELNRYDPENGLPETVTDFDALLIRTVTQINSDSLPEAGLLKFIGTATAGFDHVDAEHLKRLGIAFARSEGCNANAVGEYVITVLFRWAEETGIDLGKKKIGVIGCGNTGGKVIGYLQKLGITTVQYDPPKEEREADFQSAGLNELLKCDILTFHTPLTFSGKHVTFYMCSSEWLNHKFDLIINTARGGVVDEHTLEEAVDRGNVQNYILDVWENEPVFEDEIARKAFIATPHIAGYSKQAKWQASNLVIEEMCRFFGLKRNSRKFEADLNNAEINVDQKMTFAGFLWENTNIRYYDEHLRKLTGMKDAEKARKFAKLRSETETRMEFREIVRMLEEIPENLKSLEIFAR